ncbi:MAG: hypothetical protein AAGH92_01610 [Planctomycetota bacterium]
MIQLTSRFVFAVSLGLPAATGCAQTPANPELPRFPTVVIADVFEPPGESNVRSSFKLAEGVALIGTEETGDIYAGRVHGDHAHWKKIIDGGDTWGIQDVRNFLRAEDGRLFATTSEPALVLRSADNGATWESVAEAEASRTVALEQLATGEILVGLRRSENDRISVLRSRDGFDTFETIVVDDSLPRQNTTCLIDLSGMEPGVVLTGVGFEASGKVYRSADAGSTWTQVAEFPEARDLMNFFVIGERVFVLASGISTIFVSDDLGQTWRKHAQVWDKGFLGQHAEFQQDGRTYHLLAGTDQREDLKRHVLLISDDAGDTWHEWIELATDTSGGASNLAVISDDTMIVGTGNHSVQGRAYMVQAK